MNEGERIIFIDPENVEPSLSGVIAQIFDDEDGEPFACVIETDEGEWVTLDLTACRIYTKKRLN